MNITFHRIGNILAEIAKCFFPFLRDFTSVLAADGCGLDQVGIKQLADDLLKREIVRIFLRQEEFGNLDRTYKKSANGQGYEKVKPTPEKHGKKK